MGYSWFVDGDATLVSDPYVRMAEDDHSAQADHAYDIFQITKDGRLTLRHNGVPVIGEVAVAAADGVSSLQALFGGGHVAAHGSGLMIAVGVDQSGGGRGISKPTGWEAVGSTTTHGNNRFQTFEKVASGGEVGSPSVAITGGTAEMIVILIEVEGMNKAWLEDEEDTETGTSTSPQTVEATLPDEAISAHLGFVLSRLEAHTAPAPTDGYIEVGTAASTSMRMSAYAKVTDVITDIDFGVTLDASVAWIIRAVAMTPTFTLLEADPDSSIVLVRNALMRRLEDEPDSPATKHGLLYLRSDPLILTMEQLAIKMPSGFSRAMPFASEGGPQYHEGNGSPETVVTAPVGSMFIRRDGGAATTLYIKETGTGNTGWVAK